ncbi:hypothetical protein E2C01_037527 [Portunus trituberculatus]|uniref:Uncharacterized protein n=1 Tax=Portunus trituberculatus TaxID=210409 RepID=A0A5B7FFJ6_PORTR|nr:hypothetical protein [Portunus trituberculatus]
MVMNTFRSKWRRRRDELFRRGSDESDEWQFVPFNPSVYPANNNNSHTINNNGTTSPSEPSAPPLPKPALRPWALQRASWHEGHPPVPPHGHGSVVKTYYPLPPCPDPSPPPLPPHGHGHGHPMYPGSVPPWYGAQFHMSQLNYPASVPPGQARPSPVVLRRTPRQAPPPAESSPPSGTSRPTSGGPTANSRTSRPNSSGAVPSTGDSRPNSVGPTATTGGSRPNSSGSISTTGNSKSNSGGITSNTGVSRPNSSGPGASSGGSRPSSGGPTSTPGSSRPSSGSTGGSRPNSGGPFVGNESSIGAPKASRPSSGCSDTLDGPSLSPEGPAPEVPPHGRPAVPPHLVSPRNNIPGATLPPPPTVPLPPPPVPAHAPGPVKPTHLNLEHLTPYLASLLPTNEESQQQQEQQEGTGSPNSPEYKLPVDQVHEYRSPCSSPEADPGNARTRPPPPASLSTVPHVMPAAPLCPAPPITITVSLIRNHTVTTPIHTNTYSLQVGALR